jgi:hypothetical protein
MKPSEALVHKASDISKDVGLVLFAVVVVEPLINGSQALFSVLGGWIFAFFFWALSLILAYSTDYESSN